MKLILIRHGAYGPDKSLSQEGVSEVEALKVKLQLVGITIDKIYSSPVKRAHETARIIGSDEIIEIIDLLDGTKDPILIKEHIEKESGTIVLVGHNPFMGYLSALYGASVHFNTASCIQIEEDGKSFTTLQ